MHKQRETTLDRQREFERIGIGKWRRGSSSLRFGKGNFYFSHFHFHLKKKKKIKYNELWEFLSKNNLEDLFVTLVDKKIVAIESLLNISKDTIHNHKLGLEYAEEVRLLSVLEKVNISQVLLL